MKLISKRHRFQSAVIRLAMWLYYRSFMASVRDVEEILTEHRHLVSFEMVSCWVNKFDPAIAANIR